MYKLRITILERIPFSYVHKPCLEMRRLKLKDCTKYRNRYWKGDAGSWVQWLNDHAKKPRETFFICYLQQLPAELNSRAWASCTSMRGNWRVWQLNREHNAQYNDLHDAQFNALYNAQYNAKYNARYDAQFNALSYNALNCATI